MKIITNKEYWNTFVNLQTTGLMPMYAKPDTYTPAADEVDIYADLVGDIVLLDTVKGAIRRDYNFKYDLLCKAVELKTFAAMNPAEKLIACDNLAVRGANEIDAGSMVGFYMGYSLTLAAATDKVKRMIVEHWEDVAACYVERMKLAKQILMDYLSPNDLGDFATSTAQFIPSLRENGIVWKGFHDNTSGIVDWIRNENEYTSNGLAQKGYTLLKGTLNDLITELTDALIYRENI